MKLFGIALTLLILSGLVMYAQEPDNKDSVIRSIMDTDLMGKPVPAFTATTLDGKEFSTDNLAGRVYMVHFWSLNCAACFQELAELNRLLILYRRYDFTIVSIMDNSREELWKRFDATAKGYRIKKPVFGNDSINFQIIPDETRIMDAFHIPRSFPRSFIVDTNGMITFHKLGYAEKRGIPGEITSMDFFQDHLDDLFGLGTEKRASRNSKVRILNEGDKIPYFAATGIDETLLSTPDLRDKKLCIQFYSPNAALPVLEVNRLIDQYKDSDIVFLNVCLNCDLETWTNHIQKNHLQGLNLLAEGKWGEKIIKEFNLPELPSWILVDKGGVLVQKPTDLDHVAGRINGF